MFSLNYVNICGKAVHITKDVEGSLLYRVLAVFCLYFDLYHKGQSEHSTVHTHAGLSLTDTDPMARIQILYYWFVVVPGAVQYDLDISDLSLLYQQKNIYIFPHMTNCDGIYMYDKLH